jgi:hypothetical protein
MADLSGSKGVLASKGVWGGLIAILPMALSLLSIVGINISAADAQGLMGHIDVIIAAIGGLLAIYGRITAKKVIGA